MSEQMMKFMLSESTHRAPWPRCKLQINALYSAVYTNKWGLLGLHREMCMLCSSLQVHQPPMPTREQETLCLASLAWSSRSFLFLEIVWTQQAGWRAQVR